MLLSEQCSPIGNDRGSPIFEDAGLVLESCELLQFPVIQCVTKVSIRRQYVVIRDGGGKIENVSPVFLLQGIELLLALGQVVTHPPKLLPDHRLARDVKYRVDVSVKKENLGSAPVGEVEDVLLLPFPQGRHKHRGT